jgi:hypothetical protein
MNVDAPVNIRQNIIIPKDNIVGEDFIAYEMEKEDELRIEVGAKETIKINVILINIG